MLQIEVLFSQDNILYTGQECAIYVLVKISPLPHSSTYSGGVSGSHLATNLALLLDNSSSMYEADQRIYLAVEAASRVVSQLDTNDTVSVIAFSQRACVVLPAVPAHDHSRITRAIKEVLNTPRGTTNLAEGLRVACAELHRKSQFISNNRVLVLTDGNTENPENCLKLALEEAGKNISFSCFGLGEDWNENLIRNIASQTGGRWYYIASPPEIEPLFQEEFRSLLGVGYTGVRLKLNFYQDDVLREALMVSPEVREVVVKPGATNRIREITIGSSQKDEPVYLLLTLKLISRQPGRYNVAGVRLLYDQPGQGGQESGSENLVLGWTTDPNSVFNNGEVLRWVDDASLDKMVRQATEFAAKGDKKRATRLFENARMISDKRRDRTKTRLLDEALAQLDGQGQLNRKTHLQALNQSRKTNLLPPDEY